MIKLRLTGNLDELSKMASILEKNVTILSRTNPIQNHNSNFYRVYITIGLEDASHV